MNKDKFHKELLGKRNCYPNINFAGIHYYSDTQKRDSAPIKKELHYLDYLNRIWHLPKLEYGPGIMVSYFESQDSQTGENILCEVANDIKEISQFQNMGIEMGRFIAAPAGKFYTKVLDIKENAGKKYYILDGGRNHFIYPNWGIGIKTPVFKVSHQKNQTRKIETVTVCGPLCTSNDIIMKNVELNACDIGDLFIFEKLGAYSSTESMALFLQHKYPAIYIKDGTHFIKVQDNQYLL